MARHQRGQLLAFGSLLAFSKDLLLEVFVFGSRLGVEQSQGEGPVGGGLVGYLQSARESRVVSCVRLIARRAEARGLRGLVGRHVRLFGPRHTHLGRERKGATLRLVLLLLGLRAKRC